MFLYAGQNTTSTPRQRSQNYDVSREEYKNGKLKDKEIVGEDLTVAPPTSPEDVPDYENDFVPGAIESLPAAADLRRPA